MTIAKQAVLFLGFLSIGTIGAQFNTRQSDPLPSTPEQTVSIYITAATKKGILVTDLRPENLAITEDNVPAKIVGVTCGKPERLLVGILVDVSGSERTDSHRRFHYDELQTFVDHLLNRGNRVYVVAFDQKIYKLSEVMSDRAEISPAFDKLKRHEPLSSTALYDAIKAVAGANFKDRSERRVLLVIGDWEDNSSRVHLEDAVQAAQQSSTTIYAIADYDTNLKSKRAHRSAIYGATEVTKQTGGMVYEVDEKEAFAKALQTIGAAVMGSCRVDYTTAINASAQKGIKLHVETNSKDVSILYPHSRFSGSQ